MFGFLIVVFVVGIIIAVICSIAQQKERGEMISCTSSSLEKSGFVITKQVTDSENNTSILLDDSRKKWAIIQARTGQHTVFQYGDLIEYEVLEDGNSIMKGKVGSTLVGGLLFGGVGAIVGGMGSRKMKKTCRSMSVRIVTNSIDAPLITIPLLTVETNTNSMIYTNAAKATQELTAVLAVIKARAEQEKGLKLTEGDAKPTASDEIEKLFALKEKGILTEEEFVEKKKQLLNLV